MEVCHDSACDGHFSKWWMAQKALQFCYFWLAMLIDVHSHAHYCDVYQFMHKMTSIYGIIIALVLAIDAL